MFKIIFLVVPVVVMAAAQGFFIYGLASGGAEQYRQLWHSFDVTQTEYSKFVFSTINMWWALPVVCLVASALSFYYSIKKLAFFIVLFTLLATIALFWSAYAPELWLEI